ncbi:hypothetical protein [Commensalibacter oyaizuii]|uniref:Uncharacterized protein n=1 Tax=Commensalibacter oyaizuii TaxID=3043873 RepID=A0ABT6Q2T7_9PROT|nr:hypothetical protein [Commensalibacter sp. TBRC 16381]MDI2091438.1 hypothetical protein [Commensalibacter sp. TBRC 16381]
MSEYRGNYDPAEPPSYPFTGSAPIDPEEYFSLMPTPEGMKPIVDLYTGMCIGYDDKHGHIYDFEGKLAHKYIYDPPLEEPWFSPDDLIGLGGPALVKKAIAPAARVTGRALNRMADIAINKAYTGMHIAENTVTNPASKALQIRANRLKAKKDTLARGEEWKYPTNIQISKQVLAAPITFLLKTRLKKGLSAITLKFEETALRHMGEKWRYVPKEILEFAIRHGVRSKDQSNRGFGLMYAMYNLVVYRGGKEFVLEVLVNERTWTIKHFLYTETPKFFRSQAGRATIYRSRSIFERPFIKDMRQFEVGIYKTGKYKIELPPK